MPITAVPLPPSRRVALFLGALSLAGLASAQEPATRVPTVILTGRIQAPDGTRSLALTAAVLDKLPQRSFTSNAPWTKRPHTYSGVLLRDLLAHVRATGSQVEATALNDYAATVPVDDARQHDVLLAYRVDGQPIPVRERGPMLIMYPFDDKPELQAKRYYERSIWQLRTLNVQ